MEAPDPAALEALVADYLDHLNDGDYVRRIFAHTETAVAVLAAMLGSGDRERVHAATLVLRDAVLYPYVKGLQHLVPRTELLGVLGRNLYAPHYAIRLDSIFTLGKLTYPREAAALAQAFSLYRERYPLELPRLLGELFWLSARERRRRWDYLNAVARAPHYLVRWSVFEAAGDGWVGTARHSKDARLYRRLLRRLAQDPHPFVRWEARQRLESDRRWGERRSGVGAPEALGDPRFENVSIQFGNYLSVSGRPDYDLALLDRFAHYVVSGAARAAIAAVGNIVDQAQWEAAILAFDRWGAPPADASEAPASAPHV